MNHDGIIKATNRVGMLAAAALVYWVFIFLTITVFNLKVFREHMTEMFLLSVLGIFAVLGGAVVLNVMANLSKISQAIANRSAAERRAPARRRWVWAVAALSFPLIVGGLFVGDRLSSARKEKLLVEAAQRLVAENQAALSALSAYEFSPDFIRNTGRTLGVINKLDKNFPEVMLLETDQVDGKTVYLAFKGDEWSIKEAKEARKVQFIHRTSREERDYLARAFSDNGASYRFDAEKNHYNLYFPAEVNGRRLVILLSDYQRYGKFGS